MPASESAPWAKYLDKTQPVPESTPDEFRIISEIAGESFSFVLVRDWRRGAGFQKHGIPAVGYDEISVLETATNGANLGGNMTAAILRVKSILGGAVVAAKSLK